MRHRGTRQSKATRHAQRPRSECAVTERCSSGHGRRLMRVRGSQERGMPDWQTGWRCDCLTGRKHVGWLRMRLRRDLCNGCRPILVRCMARSKRGGRLSCILPVSNGCWCDGSGERDVRCRFIRCDQPANDAECANAATYGEQCATDRRVAYCERFNLGLELGGVDLPSGEGLPMTGAMGRIDIDAGRIQPGSVGAGTACALRPVKHPFAAERW